MEEIRNVISHGVLYDFCHAEPRKARYLVDLEEVADKLLYVSFLMLLQQISRSLFT